MVFTLLNPSASCFRPGKISNEEGQRSPTQVKCASASRKRLLTPTARAASSEPDFAISAEMLAEETSAGYCWVIKRNSWVAFWGCNHLNKAQQELLNKKTSNLESSPNEDLGGEATKVLKNHLTQQNHAL